MSGNSFLAIDLSVSERHDLAAALHEASPGPRIPGRRSHPDNWHITLRFLGPIDELLRDRLSMELERSVDGRSGHVRVSGLGAFPRASKATVLFGAVSDPDELLDPLAAQCETVCRDVGMEPEERPFRPHLTLARIRPPQDVRRLIGAFGEFSVRVAVKELSLMTGRRDRDGLHYECDERFAVESHP